MGLDNISKQLTMQAPQMTDVLQQARASATFWGVTGLVYIYTHRKPDVATFCHNELWLSLPFMVDDKFKISVAPSMPL